MRRCARRDGAQLPSSPGVCLASSFPAHAALVRKDRLVAALQHSFPDTWRDIVGDAAVVPAGRSAHLARGLVQALAQRGHDCVVAKAASTNNAQGVHFVATDGGADAAVEELLQVMQPDWPALPEAVLQGSWLLQAYPTRLCTLRGRKFHVRLNALVHGRTAAYVHCDAVCHVATQVREALLALGSQPGRAARRLLTVLCAQPFIRSEWINPWVHVTNHGTQRQHPAFGAAQQTLLLRDAEAELGAGWYAATMRAMARAVVQVLQAALAAGPGFMPMHNCFELLGFDFLLTVRARNSSAWEHELTVALRRAARRAANTAGGERGSGAGVAMHAGVQLNTPQI